MLALDGECQGFVEFCVVLPRTEQTPILQQRYLAAMRDALAHERGIGAYSSETYRQVEALLDSLEHRTGMIAGTGAHDA